jgi:sugar phosphate isomerase/epimerase
MATFSRRDFLKTSASVAAAAAILPSFRLKTEKPIGIQLWSVRDAMQEDADKTIKALARAGYNYVEGFGYKNGQIFDMPIGDFKKILKEYELKMPSSHFVVTSKHYDYTKKDLTDEFKKAVEDALKMGQRYFISPFTVEEDRKSPDGFKEFCDILNKAGEYCKAQNLKFGYHNHAFEFKTKWGDKMMYDVLLENTAAENVTLELDWMWAVAGGQNVVEMFTKHGQRFELAHVKDLAEEGKDESTIFGEGIIDMEAILKNTRKGGTKMLIVELEHYQKSSVEDVKECIGGLREMLDDIEEGKVRDAKKKKKKK